MVNDQPSPGTRKALKPITVEEQTAIQQRREEEKKYGTTKAKFYSSSTLGLLTLGGILFGFWKTFGTQDLLSPPRSSCACPRFSLAGASS